MNDWTAGYVADIGYTYGYYAELNPLRASLPMLNRGFEPPPEGACCELGFGQGVSANFHAAGGGAEWWGTDFNPRQALFAQRWAKASGAKCHFSDESFAEFCSRADLPDFSYICLHGIWSWISEENRKVIVDFVRRKLVVGGLLYISYNTQPGWAAFAPLRDLMLQFSETMVPAAAGSEQRVGQSLAFVDQLFSVNPHYTRVNVNIGDRVAKLKTLDKSYLAHEYFNRDWHPMAFDAMAKALAPAKMDFVGSANYIDHVDLLNLSSEQKAFLEGIKNTNLRETARDFVLNTQFRKDYWVKGATPVGGAGQLNLLRDLRIVLTRQPSKIAAKITCITGEASLDQGLLDLILSTLVEKGPTSVRQFEELCAKRDMSFAQLFQALMVLGGRGDLATCRDAKAGTNAVTAQKMNDAILKNALTGIPDIPYLVSPVTGGGVIAPRLQQIFVLGVRNGGKNVADIMNFVRTHFPTLTLTPEVEGGEPSTPERTEKRLHDEVSAFLSEVYPMFKHLGIH